MIAGILAFSVRNRWLVLLLSLLVAGFGVWSMQKLPIDAVPDITNTQVQISTIVPSLSPVDVEKQVTYPIEIALTGIGGLASTRSLTHNGFSQVTAVFNEGVDIYYARQQVSERLVGAKGTLPPGAEPRIGPISTGLGEIYMWSVGFAKERTATEAGAPGWQPDGSYLTPDGQALKGDVELAAYLREVEDWIIRPRLRMVQGVAGIDTIGGYEKQFHVQPDVGKLVALDVSFADVIDALERNNANRSGNYLNVNGEAYVVLSIGRLDTMEDIRNVLVTTRAGVPVRIADIANVGIGRELRIGAASRDGREAVIGTALMLIGGNSRTVAGAVDAELKRVVKSLPPGIAVETVLDRRSLVESTIRTVADNLLKGAALVVVILFVLLGNFRAALIAALVIPVAMLMTAIGMVEAKISANLMSLGALDFGLIVDGAVIIAENALRHLAGEQHGLSRALTQDERLASVQAAAEEMIKPSLFGQAIIILVYVPLLTFSGVEGKMFQPMALTVIIALISAFVLTMTFVPALIAIVITGRVSEGDSLVIRAFKRAYRPVLAQALERPLPLFVFGLVLLVGAGLLFKTLGQEFIPTLDEKSVAMDAQRIASTSIEQSQTMQYALEKAIGSLPEVATVFSKTGTPELSTDPVTPDSSDTFVILKPQDKWPDPSLPKPELERRLLERTAKLLGNSYELSQPIQLRFNELLAGVRGDLVIKVFGDEFGPMRQAAVKIADVLRTIKGAQDVKVEQTTGLPFLDIAIDKAAAARFGLSTSAIQDVVGAAIGGREAGLVYKGDRRFPIVVRLDDRVRDSIDRLGDLPVPLQTTNHLGRASVLLKQVATFKVTEGPNQISRENGHRRVYVSANVRGRDIGSVVAQAQARIDREVPLPSGSFITWGGQYENLVSVRQRLAIVVPVCFFAIFLLLYTALNSARDALIVFAAVPLALTGGVAALWLRGMPVSVPAAVGFIALSGIAVLNGLVMLTFMNALIAAGMSPRAAIIDGAMTRLRPVAMTALVASLGFVPTALATGTGAEIQRPLATVVIGGLISSTLLTLLMLPAFYGYFAIEGREESMVIADTDPVARAAE